MKDFKNMDVLKNKISKNFKTILIYFLLVSFGYVFLYPLIYSIALSFMPYEDVLNPTVNLIPQHPTLDNYRQAIKGLNYFPILLETIVLTLASTIAQTISCAIIGYGFGKYDFPLKKFFLLLILVLFVIPVQVTSIPMYLMLQQLNLINSPLGLIIPALFGQGLKSTIFILIFYQVFDNMPKVLDEAAQVDGASAVRRFTSISLPLAKPAILLTFLFSFIWYWNETYLSTLYLGQKYTTLPMQLRMYVASLNNEKMAETGVKMFQTIEMSSVVLSILPLLILYMLLQKNFTESIEKTGITGE